MTARLIADTPDHTDLGPATPEHIAEQARVEAQGETAFAVGPDTLAVVRPGQTGPSIAVWVD